ncbi:hypothetical protein [Curtobacterium ammoniigenes]|uniref:hypothetical protein n=1 Tax=Curtobacterium ammoniigenes TaxID=395387 RepID=UPI00278BDE97|nr:hypothetical protein [Curtobacterium ammoniigenes]
MDVVYYIRSEDRIKIGTSANPRRRLRVLWHDALLAFERGDRVAEQRRHRQFAFARIGSTEWFRTCDELEHHIDTLRCGIDDPWRLYARWMAEAAAAR